MRGSVLVVDDEPSICKALTIALGRAGFDAAAAESGEAAVALLRDRHVDVLVLDLRMPGMRGDVFFHLATALQPHLRTQTLYFTGDITERATTLIGACECPVVRKPFDLVDVLDVVRAMCLAECAKTA